MDVRVLSHGDILLWDARMNDLCSKHKGWLSHIEWSLPGLVDSLKRMVKPLGQHAYQPQCMGTLHLLADMQCNVATECSNDQNAKVKTLLADNIQLCLCCVSPFASQCTHKLNALCQHTQAICYILYLALASIKLILMPYNWHARLCHVRHLRLYVYGSIH